MKKVLFWAMAFLCIPILLSNPSKSLESEKKEIVWEEDYKGNVFSHVLNYDGTISSYSKIGYADGKGNYYLETIDIASNETLIIEPGITIHIIYPTYNYIYGSIKAIGTKEKNIIFTSNGTKEVWAWDGLEIYNDYPGIAVFKYCQFLYSSYIDLERDAEFDHCIFNTTCGIGVRDRFEHPVNVDNLVITNCIFTGNSSGPKMPDIRGLNVGVDKKLIVKNSLFEDNTHIINVGAGEVLSFNNNVVNTNKMVWFGCGGKGNVSNNEIGNYYIVFNNVNGYNNLINGEEIRIRNPKDEHILFRNNKIFGFITFAMAENHTQKIDLRFNSFGVDWPVEKILGLEKLENPGLIIYEPYYDLNWTLTDNDGLPNAWEAKFGMNIHTDDTILDPDKDGLTNQEEYLYEGNNETELNPKNPDTDSDLMPDGWEIINGLDPLTNDSDKDNDNDGWTNLEEYKALTNANDPNSHPKREPIWFYITISLILLVLLVTGLIVFILRRYKKIKFEDVETIK